MNYSSVIKVDTVLNDHVAVVVKNSYRDGSPCPSRGEKHERFNLWKVVTGDETGTATVQCTAGPDSGATWSVYPNGNCQIQIIDPPDDGGDGDIANQI